MDKVIFRGCLRPQMKIAAFTQKRPLHVSPVGARYQINYDQLRDGNLANLASHDYDLLVSWYKIEIFFEKCRVVLIQILLFRKINIRQLSKM